MAQSAKRSSRPPVVKSAARTLQVLEYFDEVRRPANVAAVAAALGYPQSSAAALMRSMVVMGYLQHDATARTYRPTDRVALLGNWISPSLFAEGKLANLLKCISDRTSQAVLLGARNGDDAQYIQVLRPSQDRATHIKLGMLRPLATSGIGRVLLSTLRDADVAKLLRRINAFRQAGQDVLDVQHILRTLQQVRERGHYLSRDRVVAGLGLIAVPIPAAFTDRPLVIGVVAETHIICSDQEQIIAAVKEEIDRNFSEAPRVIDDFPPMPTARNEGKCHDQDGGVTQPHALTG